MNTQKLLLVTVASILFSLGAFHTMNSFSQGQDAVPAHIHTLYSKWLVKYGSLKATPASNDYRLRIFHKTFLEIQTFRKTYPNTQFALNKFANLTFLEKENNYTGDIALPDDIPETPQGLQAGSPIPSSFSVKNNRVVKSQGQCGSCWAWAAAHYLEDWLHKTIEVSRQDIVNCDTRSHGCRGGSAYYGLNMVKSRGYTTQAIEPYTAKNGSCASGKKHWDIFSRMSIDFQKPKSRKVTGTYPEDIFRAKMVSSKKSMTISMKTGRAFYAYRGGIFNTNSPECKLRTTSHAMTFVAYDATTNTLKNSWGTFWGDKGFVVMTRNAREMTSPGLCFCGGGMDGFRCKLIAYK